MLSAILTLLAGNTADAFILKDLLTKSKNFQVILHSFCFNLKTSALFVEPATETPVLDFWWRCVFKYVNSAKETTYFIFRVTETRMPTLLPSGH